MDQGDFLRWEEGPQEVLDQLDSIPTARVVGLVLPKEELLVPAEDIRNPSELVVQSILSSDVAERQLDLGQSTFVPELPHSRPFPCLVASAPASISNRVMDIKADLDKPLDPNSAEHYVEALRELESMNITADVLTVTEVSRSVLRLKQLNLACVSELSKPLLKKWKKVHNLDAERKLERILEDWHEVLRTANDLVDAKTEIRVVVARFVEGLEKFFDGVLKKEQTEKWALVNVMIQSDIFFRGCSACSPKRLCGSCSTYKKLHMIVTKSLLSF
jgi:hypothetical protein